MAKRTNGEGTLRKRKDGRWEARLKLPDGSKKYVYAKTQKECKAKLKEIEDRVKSGEFDIMEVESNERVKDEKLSERLENLSVEDKIKDNLPITLNEFFEYWIKIKSMSVKEQTLNCIIYEYNANIRSNLGDAYINLIRQTHIYNMVESLIKQGKNDRLINEVINMIYRILDYAYKIDLITEKVNKIDKIKTSRTDEECTGGYSVEPHRELMDFEINEFFNFLVSKKKVKLYLMCSILLNTGMRAGEMCALRVCDISGDFSYIMVKGTITSKKTYSTPKNKDSVRTIPIKKDLSDKLKDYVRLIGKCENEYIFTTSNNTPYTTKELNIAIQSIIRKINKSNSINTKIQNFTSHCFRHTFCSRGVRMGLPIKELQSITGHATATMLLDKYSHADESKKEKIIERISFNF